MADVQVTCITRGNNPSNPYYGITHVGGPGGGGWRWTKEAVIESINAGTNTFFTLVDGRRADIAVVDGGTRPYLRTHADGAWTDNLLALPACR